MLRSAVVAVLLCAVLAGCDQLRHFFPAKVYETEPPQLPVDLGSPALLVFTKTNGYRHTEAIAAGVALFEEVAARRGWSLFHTENGATFNEEQLARFGAVVWLNTSRDILTAGQKEALKAYVEAGGGFVGVHGAGGDPDYVWQWYVETLIGAQFTAHIQNPQLQDAEVVVEVRDHPATRHLSARFTHNEEWYSFDRSPRGGEVTVLASVDESTYSPLLNIPLMKRDLSMGDHPVIWQRCVSRGRVFYSALGHLPSAYQNEHAGILEGAAAWAMALEGEGCR